MATQKQIDRLVNKLVTVLAKNGKLCEIDAVFDAVQLSKESLKERINAVQVPSFLGESKNINHEQVLIVISAIKHIFKNTNNLREEIEEMERANVHNALTIYAEEHAVNYILYRADTIVSKNLSFFSLMVEVVTEKTEWRDAYERAKTVNLVSSSNDQIEADESANTTN